jgi:hypothetical protein
MTGKLDFSEPGASVPLRPWVLVVSGLILEIIGLLLVWGYSPIQQFGHSLLSNFLLFGHLGSAVLGLLAAGVAVQQRLTRCGWSFMDRLETSAIVAVAGLTPMLAWLGVPPEVDGIRLFLLVAFLVSLLGALLVLLPALARRIVLSLLVVFHFGGMLTAVTSVDPPGGAGPWVSKQLWFHVYRPYLSFIYMGNAYHFYSPDPGLPSLLWFAVHFDDGTLVWEKVPDRANSPVGMHYQRMLALPEHCYLASPRLPLTRQELFLAQQQTNEPLNVRSWEEILAHRQGASGSLYNPPIPIVLDVDAHVQYREPIDSSKRVLASVARHVFWHPPKNENNPQARVRSVKLYRVTHQVLTPTQLASGMSPLDKTRYLAWFMGEFDGKGHLIGDDPFLYWYLPIVRVSPDYPRGYQDPITRLVSIRSQDPEPKVSELLDCLEIHARRIPPRAQPEDKK